MSRAGDSTGCERVMICMPVYNDWQSVHLLLKLIDQCSHEVSPHLSVLIVNDGSTEPVPNCLGGELANIVSIHVLHLRRNVGHQRAIALGLAHIHATCACDLVVVMDADGEDVPADIRILVERCRELNSTRIIFAKRARRSEGTVFKLGYFFYKLLHVLLTGRRVEVGNFSVIPLPLVDNLVGVSELWNHYAAAVYHARLLVDAVPIDRGTRLAGKTKMNLITLVTHGLCAISVYSDVIGTRLICLTSGIIVLSAAALVTTVAIRMFTELAIPGWATTAAGVLAIILLNSFTLLCVFAFFVLQSRSNNSFVPIRDWSHFVSGVEDVNLHGNERPLLRI